MNTDNTQDANEPSPASAGSQPVAWAAIGKHGQPMWLAYCRQDAEGAVVGMAEVVPLYRQPQPALTDEERAALWCAVCDYNSMTRTMHMPKCGKIGPALASLFERLK